MLARVGAAINGATPGPDAAAPPPSAPAMPASARVPVVVVAASDAGHERARGLKARLGLPLAVLARRAGASARGARRLALVAGPRRLALAGARLVDAARDPPLVALAGRPVAADLVAQASRARGRPPLVRALGRRVRPAALCVLDATAGWGRDGVACAALGARVVLCERDPVLAALCVLDATAGWGRDGVACAALGARVVLCERDPVLAALPADGLERAPRQAPALAARVRLLPGPAETALEATAADVVLLDPMFPPGRSARARKPLQLLQELLGPGDDEEAALALLDVALARARDRVLVKRPRHAPPLGGRPPTASQRGRALRWDVYLAAPRA